MSITKAFKSIIDKFNKPKAPAVSRWPELEKMEYSIKPPANIVTLSARVITTNAFAGLLSEDYIESKTEEYVKNEMAKRIARELIYKDMIVINQLNAESSDEKVYIGKIEVVSRR